LRVLVTGGNGFVGKHLLVRLREAGHEVISSGRAAEGSVDLAIDLADEASLRRALEASRPEAVVHLAAQASVPESLRDPLATYEINVLGTARLFAAVQAVFARERPRVLVASTGEVYGARELADYPLRETLAPQPATPYGASKVAAEAIASAAMRHSAIPTICTRAFNHIGAGQSDRFAVASFARQLAEIAIGGPSVLYVGNLTARRDFLDVRDVASAYVALLERGEPGETYNVCSGTPVSVQDVLRRLVMIARVPVEIREDPARMRPSEVPVYFGDNTKLRSTTGWAPEHSLAHALREVYEDEVARAKKRTAR
jgi:GDP-4-dehydro-6-deoxy-D-mannose reductase